MVETGIRPSLPGPEQRGSASDTPSAGWFPDPLGTWPRRWWSGLAWTVWVYDGETVRTSPLVARRHLDRTDLPHLGFVETVFLPELAAHGGLDGEHARAAEALVRELSQEAVEPPPAPGWPAPSVPAAPPAATPPQPTTSPGVRRYGAGPAPATGSRPPMAARTRPAELWRQQVVPASEPARTGTLDAGMGPDTVGPPAAAVGPIELAVEPPAPYEPGPVARWWARTGESVRSDLAVHGVAYIGVLLFFIGAFGLVAFAFGDVQPGLRPVAELVIALVPFGAATVLLQRGAGVVGRALELAGGLLLPVMLITSFLDGVAFPPDATGVALVVALTASCALVAAAYAAWAVRHRDSALKYVVAPVVWLATAMATLGLGRPIPSGEGVVVPASAQMAVTLGMLALTVAWARLAPGAHLARPTCVAAVPGLAVLAMLTLLTWVREDSPWPAALVGAGLLGVAAIEMLSAAEPPGDRLPRAWASTIESTWWAATILALVGVMDPAWAASIGAIGFLVLLEIALVVRGSATASGTATLLAPAMGAVVLIALSVGEPWATTGVLAVASAWALARRRDRELLRGLPIRAIDVGTALLPVLTLLALAIARDSSTALLAGTILLLPATALAGRSSEEFWREMWTPWLAVLVIFSVSLGSEALAGPEAPAGVWLQVAAAALLALAAGTGPWERGWKLSGTAALGAWTWVLACAALDLPHEIRGSILAIAALGMTGLAYRSSARTWGPAPGITGHAMAAAALVASGDRWGLVAAFGLFTCGWVLAALGEDDPATPAGALVADLRSTRVSPAAWLATASAAATVLAALRTVDATRWTLWVAPALACIGLAVALAVRAGRDVLDRRNERLTPTLAWASSALASTACVLAADSTGAIVALAALVAVALTLPGTVRWRGMVWLAWSALAPLAGLVLAGAWESFATRPEGQQAGLALVAVGALILVPAWAADTRLGPWVPRPRPRRAALTPPSSTGGALLVAGLGVLGAWVPEPVTGWVLLGASGVLLAVGLMARMGALGALSALAAWIGAVILSPGQTIPPLVGVGLVAVLLVAAEALGRLLPDPRWWARWDVPLLVAAIPIASVALVDSAGTSTEAATRALVGVLVGLCAVRLRALPAVAGPLAITAVGLILAGANSAGPWWLVGALVALAVGLTVSAVPRTGPARLVLQVAGAITAVIAWDVATWAGEIGLDQAADLTALGAGVVCALAGAGLHLARPRADWSLVWGGTGAALVAIVCVGSWIGADGLSPTAPIALGLALLAVGLALAAGPLDSTALRDCAVVAGFAGLLTWLQSSGASDGIWIGTFAVISLAAAVATPLAQDRVLRPLIETGVVSAVVALTAAGALEASAPLLALALAVCAVQAAVVGSRLGMLVVQALAPPLVAAAWLVLGTDLLDDFERVADVTSVGAGAVCLAAAVALRSPQIARRWPLLWGGTSAVLVAGLAACGWIGALDLAPTVPLAVGVALVAAACLLAAQPLSLGGLSDAGAIALVVALVTGLEALDATDAAWIWTLASVSTAAAASMWLARRASRMLIEVGALAAVLALAVALGAEVPTSLLVLALVACAIQAAAVGSTLQLVLVQALAPVLCSAAWLVFATASLEDRIDLWLAPVGVAVLVIVGLWRMDRRRRGQPMGSPEVVTLEVTGVGLLVGPSLVLTVTDSLGHAIPALLLGIAVVAWGAITQVRRRLVMGAGAVLASLVLLVGVPMVRLLPEWEGAGLWILLLCLGIAALAFAALIERGRAVARSALGRFGDLTQGWE